MNRQIQSAIEKAIGFAVSEVRAVGGGCINQAQAITLDSGQVIFAKHNQSNDSLEMLKTEAAGLVLLRSAGTIRVPHVIDLVQTANGTCILILEFINGQSAEQNFFQRLGSELAELHRITQPAFGLENDNFIGATPQQNHLESDWAKFWAEHRFGYQIELARRNGYLDRPFNDLSDRLQNRIPELLKTDEPPALIHGDLWSGNFMVGPGGEPVLIDPAVYFAHREAEFGITTLFGGFDQSFYDAYNEVWPLAAGSEVRIELYRLYHLLNHLNLFGSSYLSDCQAIMKKYC